LERPIPDKFHRQYRWRAARYGIDGKLIDFGKEAEVEERSLLNELLEFVSTEVNELGSEKEMAHIERIIGEGTGADRQLASWQRTQDMKAVVDVPIDYQNQDFVEEIHRLTSEGVDVVFDSMGGTHIWRSRKGSASWRDSSGLWPYFLATWGPIGFRQPRSPSSLSWNRHLRVVYRGRLAFPEPETGGPLQDPVAQTAEAGIVSRGFDCPV
jgi:hypothetical protein